MDERRGRDVRHEQVINSVANTGGRSFEDRRGPLVAKRSNFTPKNFYNSSIRGNEEIRRSSNGSILIPVDDVVKHLKGKDYVKWPRKLSEDPKATS